MTLKDIALKHMVGWSLYDESHEISTRDIGNGVWLGYRTTKSHQLEGTTYFNVNVVNGIFFILEISVDPPLRGRGHGDALYKILEEIAAEAGCHKVQMTASGWCETGETRMDYLLRRGYTKFGIEVMKDIA